MAKTKPRPAPKLLSTTKALRVVPARGLKFYRCAGLRFPHKEAGAKEDPDPGTARVIPIASLLPSSKEECAELARRLEVPRRAKPGDPTNFETATPAQVQQARILRILGEPNLVVEQLDEVPEEDVVVTHDDLVREIAELRERLAKNETSGKRKAE